MEGLEETLKTAKKQFILLLIVLAVSTAGLLIFLSTLI